MADEILLINNFSGGISSGSKVGIQGAFKFGSGLDIRSDPDILKVSPASTKDSGSTVTGLVLFGVNNTVNSNKYFLDENGKLYKRVSSGTYSVLSTYTNAEGMGFFSGTNLIYFNSDDQQYTLNPATDSVSSYRTLSSSTWHPTEPFLDKIFTGNGKELISTDASAIDYTSSTTGGGITIDFNYSIKCLKTIQDWLFIGTTSDNSTDAKVFIWDGYSDNYNFVITLKGEDGINAVERADDGTVLIFAGKKGHIYQMVSIDAPLMKIKNLPRIENDKTIEIYPGATTNYQGFPLFGLSTGTSITAERGIYSWGATDKNYPKVLNLDYLISTGTSTGTTLQIGCLLAASTTELFVSWRDGSTYGVDLIDGSGVQAAALYESLIFDARQPYRFKTFKTFIIKLAGDLATNEVLDLYYQDDRDGTWTQVLNSGESNTLDYAVDGAVSYKRFAPDIRCRELEIRLVWANAGSTATKIDSLTSIFTTESVI